MGQRHRQRRAAATHRARAGASDRPSDRAADRPAATAGFTADGRYDPRAVIDDLLAAGVRQVRRLGRPGDPGLPEVFAGVHRVGRDDLVDDLLAHHLVPLLADVWARGWSPIDLVHAMGQRFDTAHADLVAAAVLHDPALQRDDRPQVWTDHLATLRQRRTRRGAGQAEVDLVTRFQLVLALARLPEVVPVVVPPSQWRAAAAAAPVRERRPGETVDPRMLERVRALLAKAESTGFEAEAEAFMGKAQELMAKYAIDAAMVSAATADARSLAAGVEARRLHLDDPYAAQKAQLLGAVAAVYGGHVVWHEGWGFATVIGFPVELELTELTFTSLLVQMTRAMANAGAAGGRTRSASFRRAFVLAYAQRIGERLDEARRRVDVEAGEQYGGALVPVQEARRAAVEQRSKEWFPDTRPMRSRSVDAGGWYAGRSAADLADIEPGLGEIA
ncbi:MAG: DUF2786 domain-containing protein [Acidimicrobiales bacterium]